VGDCVEISLNRTGSGPGGGGSNPLLSIYENFRPDPDYSPTVCVLVDFRNAYWQLCQVRDAAALWSEGVRENYEQWQLWLAVLQHLSGLRLTCGPVPGGVSVDVVVTVEEREDLAGSAGAEGRVLR